MPSGNLQIVNASQEDEGMYKCAAYNPVTQEVKTSGSSDRLRVRRKGQGLADGRGVLGVPQFTAQICVLQGGSEGCWARASGTLKTQDSAGVGGPGWGGPAPPASPSAASHNPQPSQLAQAYASASWSHGSLVGDTPFLLPPESFPSLCYFQSGGSVGMCGLGQDSLALSR